MNRRTFIHCTTAAPWLLAGCASSRQGSSLRWKPLASLPDRLGLAAPFAGVSGGSLLVAGGANFPNGFPWQGGSKVWHDVVYRLDSPAGAWAIAGRLPRPLAYGVSLNVGRGVVCIGGSDAHRHHAAVFGLIIEEGSLRVEPMASLPVPLASSAGALVGRQILVCGGTLEPGESSALNWLWSLDLDRKADGWRELEPLPAAPRFLSVAAAHDDDFFLFGGVNLEVRQGRTSRVYLRDAWRYGSRTGWRQMADLPRPLAAAPSPAPVVGREILLLPGDDGSRFGFQPPEQHPGFPRRLLAYDIPQNRWREAGEAPFALVTTPCVAWKGEFIVPGGEIRPGVRSPEVWSLMRP